MLYCGESNVAPSKYSIMDNKNHFKSKVSDFLEAMRKAGYSESTIRQYKKTCRLIFGCFHLDYLVDLQTVILEIKRDGSRIGYESLSTGFPKLRITE